MDGYEYVYEPHLHELARALSLSCIFVFFRSEMAENPKAEALRRNFPFIQESMATSGLTTIAGHLLRLDLITGENHRDIIEPCGIGPDRKAAMLMTSVEVRIRDNPDVYFTRFIEALRRSHLGNVADRLVQALPEDQRHSTCKCVIGDYKLSSHAVLVLHYSVY